MTPAEERVMRQLIAQVAEHEHKAVDLRARAALLHVGLDPDNPAEGTAPLASHDTGKGGTP